MKATAHSQSARARVRDAEAQLSMAETNLQRSVQPWRVKVQNHRTATLLLGGFTAGIALTLLPTRWWGRIGAVVGSLSAAAARSLITPAFVGAAIGRVRSGKSSSNGKSAAAESASR